MTPSLPDGTKTFGAGTTKEMMGPAPREVPEHRWRALALIRLRAAASGGAFDLALLEDKGDYRW
ncbi:type II toxin-antitoxin system VapB family antitoxin [Streptomyces sp. NPDC101110]|uniref:type II toxin-antitoxin system VapB family antitoxin n=1 Tax=unclassified Streptomyces TaxID=2593676 RepID=UPI00381376E6